VFERASGLWIMLRACSLIRRTPTERWVPSFVHVDPSAEPSIFEQLFHDTISRFGPAGQVGAQRRRVLWARRASSR